MAETIVYGVARSIVVGLGNMALEEIHAAWYLKKEVKYLEDTLSSIKEVLPHAEQLQLGNNDVKLWLRRMKDAAYVADDVVDDFFTRVVRRRLMMQDGVITRVRYFTSSSNSLYFNFRMSYRIKKVRRNLKRILDDQSFGFQKRVEGNDGALVSERSQVHSYPGKVVGRDGERDEVVKLLLDSGEEDRLSVIPIRGMGGMGKTALAQLVYNDERLSPYFEKKLWVCVSLDFNVKIIVKKIIESATESKCSNLEMDQLQSHLRKHIEGTRFLLVLDDVWNEDFEKWEKLKDLLMVGANGSKIIVTTRSERVVWIMRAVKRCTLSGLSIEDCWELFRGRAFGEGEELAHPELVKIGREIILKCGGVPLAATTLGGLCFQAKIETWEYVRDSDIWKLPEVTNGILHAQRISYMKLSFYQKQCFAYCSIFPKDFLIKKDTLIHFWIAQGFIPPSSDKRSLEAIGNEYVDILMWRSFFQEPVVDESGNLKEFKMHGLVHDLAKSVAGVECFTVCKDQEEDFPKEVRHLFFDVEVSSNHRLPKLPNIRTLVFTSVITRSVAGNFSRMKSLRVLQFNADHIKKLPKSIDILQHLRYIQIQCNKIKKLPKSFTNLLNLQYLILRCSKLEKLPDGIQRMVSLKHIDFGCTTSLLHMPLGIKNLTSLQTLSHFFVSKGKHRCDLNALSGLKNLGGTLYIENLSSVRNARECENANLKFKKNLQHLILSWKHYLDSNGEVEFDVLENLEPHSNLRKLEIINYASTRFPLWAMEPWLPNVVEVKLWNCMKCEQLPPLSRLPLLKVLTLEGLISLKCVEGKLEKSQKEWFPSLRRLIVHDAPELKSWIASERDGVSASFPSLVYFEISNCPKLKTCPPLLSIENLSIKKCSGELVHSTLSRKLNQVFPLLKSLTINACEDLERLPEDGLQGLTSLTDLNISDCERLTSLSSGTHDLTSLCRLTIQNVPKLVYPPEGLGNLTSLQELHMWDKMRHMKDDFRDHGLGGWPNGFENLKSLKQLSISCCPNLPVLPQQIQHLTALQFLAIIRCEAFPDWLGSLTSLSHLVIRNSPLLEVLPECISKTDSTIEHLWIYDCDHLKSRYNKETGEDRHKIAHIRHLSFH